MSDTHFDAVIVGSGFGGSVMAYRLAEAGMRVCLLERGKRYPPGSFPRSPYQMKKNFWDPSEGLYGLYNIWSFPGIAGVVSSGLGGGSLIYANVLLRKDERWFVKEDIVKGGYDFWPVSRAVLEPHYEHVEEMMKAREYPFDQSPYNGTLKTIALQQAAEKLHMDWFLPKLAISFDKGDHRPVIGEPIREDFGNIHNHTRYTCNLCGECDVGCNSGSKNTLDYTYLSAALRLPQPVDIRYPCEVRSFNPFDHGYAIHYVRHDPEGNKEKKLNTRDTSIFPLHTITADRLILSAGTFGSTFLLLKNIGSFCKINRKVLGTRFSGNGDLISFALRCSDYTGCHREPHLIDASHGPVITSAISFKDELYGRAGRGFYIQDGGYPEFVNWMLQLIDFPSMVEQTTGISLHFLKEQVGRDVETDVSGYISRMFGTCNLSSCLLPLLGMGLDFPSGKMSLHNNKLNLRWIKKKSGPYYIRLRETMKAISDELGADFQDPLRLIKRVVTAHPLGGCPIGRNDKEGVVDAQGEVFHYKNFYIADGSVMPGPVGANPSLTIAALSDHFADGIIKAWKGKRT